MTGALGELPWNAAPGCGPRAQDLCLPPLPASLRPYCLLFSRFCDKTTGLPGLNPKPAPQGPMSEDWVPSSLALFWGYWNPWEVGPCSRKWSWGKGRPDVYSGPASPSFILLICQDESKQPHLLPLCLPSCQPASSKPVPESMFPS